jgi:uncharacterized protein (DUF488 family)
MPTIFTFGHSIRSLAETIDILQAHGIGALADVRRFAASRRYPHFSAESLRKSLPAVGIEYLHLVELGGRRPAARNSPNTGWRNASFRGYADYMQTPAFAAALVELEALARRLPTAIMCAEAVPWRCHRSLIGDALLARGWRVLDIFDRTSAKPHEMTPFAVVRGEQIVYPQKT